ncbi:MAG: ABC transporter permease [Candidatus Dormibacteraceae bacterium]
MKTATRIAQGGVGFGLLIVAWQFAVSRQAVREDYFPPPSRVLPAAAGLLTNASFVHAIVNTLEEVVLGLLLGCIVAIPLGLLMGRSSHLQRATHLLVEMLRPLPAVALAPLSILLLGLGLRSIVALVVWTSIWPILVNTIYGAQATEAQAIETARTFRLSRLRILAFVVLPSAAPLIATGLRIAVAIALAVAIAGEMVAGGGEGLGSWILTEGSAASLLFVYAAAVVAGILGVLINSGLEATEGRLFRWHGLARDLPR